MKVIRVKSRLGWDTHESYPVVEGWCTSCATYEANMEKVEAEAHLFAAADDLRHALISLMYWAFKNNVWLPENEVEAATKALDKAGGNIE